MTMGPPAPSYNNGPPNPAGGSSAYLSALYAMMKPQAGAPPTLQSGTVPVSALQALHGDDPQSQQAFGPNWNTPLTAQQLEQQAAMTSAGTPPGAVVPQSEGAAPTLASYYDPTPFNQAAASVTAGGQTAQDSINQAYAQALQNAQQQGATAQSQANAYVQQALQSAAQASGQEHQSIATALQGAAPGASLLSDQLTGQQATLDANNARGGQTAQFLSALVGANNNNFQQDIGSSKANALQYLASQLSGEQNKITQAAASAQSTGQRQYQSAMDAYNTAQNNDAITAGNADMKNASDWSANYNKALTDSTAAANSMAQSGRQSVLKQLNNGSLDPTLAQQLTTLTAGGVAADGSTPVAAAKNLSDAMSRFTPAYTAHLKAIGVNTAQLISLVQQYYDTDKTTSPAALQTYLNSLGGNGDGS